MKLALISIDGNGLYNLDNMKYLQRVGEEGYKGRMRTIFPSLTDSVHTTMLTGMYPKYHGVVENGYYDRISKEKTNFFEDDVVLNPNKHIRSKLLVDYFRESDISTASVSAYMMPPFSGTDMRIFPPFFKNDLFYEHGRNIEKDKWVINSAKYISESYDPELLLIHLCSIDAIGHEAGPGSEEAKKVSKELDKNIRELSQFLKKQDYNLVIGSDHGLKPVDTMINPEMILESRNIKVQRISPGGGSHIFLRKNQDKFEQKKIRGMEILKKKKGVRNVYKREELPYLDTPRSGDLIISSRDGYWFHNYFDTVEKPSVNSERQVKGMHGSNVDRVMDVPIIFNGEDMKVSKIEELRLQRSEDYPLDKDLPSIFDIAPTIMNFFGIKTPNNLAGTSLF